MSSTPKGSTRRSTRLRATPTLTPDFTNKAKRTCSNTNTPVKLGTQLTTTPSKSTTTPTAATSRRVTRRSVMTRGTYEELDVSDCSPSSPPVKTRNKSAAAAASSTPTSSKKTPKKYPVIKILPIKKPETPTKPKTPKTPTVTTRASRSSKRRQTPVTPPEKEESSSSSSDDDEEDDDEECIPSPPKISRTTTRNASNLNKKTDTPVKSKTPVKNNKSTPAKADLKSPFKSPGKYVGGGSVWRFNSLGVPKCPLPCRETQFEEIWTFLHENISSKGSRCLYVSGVPGTGKTVIVQSVVDTLKRYAEERKEHLKFDFVYINGLSLSSPDKIWRKFYSELIGEKMKLTPQAALKKLGSYFETKGRLPTVLVIDELDQILDKNQSILYHLLEWSSHSSTTFSLVAIFNTMSLPENGLVMRNVSRIGLTRCIFPPYTHEQLQTIIKNSLASCKTEKVKEDAIVLLSRKVAAVSGDARRALEIAKRAVEIVEAADGTISGMKAVDGAFKEIFSSPKINALRNCTTLEQMLLENLSNELQRTGSEETTLITLYNNISSSALYEGMAWSVDQFINASTRLSLMKLVMVEMTSSSIHKKISLNVPEEDLKYAFGLKSASEQ